MAHLVKDPKKLLNRINRVQGQLNAIKSLLSDTNEKEEDDCGNILQVIAACRGAMNGLMAEVIEGHVRHHVLDSNKKISPSQSKAVDELLGVVQAYLK